MFPMADYSSWDVYDPQGAEIVQRIHQKKELGCKAATYHTIEEGKSSAKESAFWEILGGRKPSHGKQPL